MSSLSLSLLVLKTDRVDDVRDFYECLGLCFVEEQHGKGPVHWSTEVGATVLEIYPLKDGATPDATTRLGFIVQLDSAAERLVQANWVEAAAARETPWGRVAVVQDPDGRKVELVDRASIEASE